MSRTSRYETNKENVWKAGLYIRLSKQDGDVTDGENSDSVESQNKILTEYIEKYLDIKIQDIYVDDGYTGRNFNRPAFIRLWSNIQAKKVNCIIVKDLSRFGRNCIETTDFIEKKFPYLGVRLISVVDNIDTLRTDEVSQKRLQIVLKNITNEQYIKDCSIKVKSVLDVKRKKGLFIGAFAPYGYKKDEKNHNKLVTDNESALVVMEIFRKFLAGESMVKIARELSVTNVPNPSEYKKLKGLNYQNPKNLYLTSNLWSVTTIKGILTNQVYVGDMVQGKYKIVNFHEKKKKQVSKQDWIIVKDTHEAIVTREDFNKVQEIFAGIKSYTKDVNPKHKLAGLIFCGDCNKAMMLKNSSNKQSYYVCKTYERYKNYCKQKSIRINNLENIVFETIKKFIDIVLSKDISVKLEKEKEDFNYKQNVFNAEKEIEKLKNLLLKIYSDLKSGEIELSDYKERKKQIEDKILVLEKTSNLEVNKEVEISKLINLCNFYKDYNELTYELAHELIERIDIYENKVVHITFKFQDEFKNLLTKSPNSAILKAKID